MTGKGSVWQSQFGCIEWELYLPSEGIGMLSGQQQATDSDAKNHLQL